MGAPAAAMLEADAAGQQRQAPTSAEQDVAERLEEIVSVLRASGDPPVLGSIREVQRGFLRLQHKFPDYVEVGIGVWEQLYDWQVHTQQTLNIGRLPDGRYGMQTLMSTFVLRTDTQPAFIGQPTDNL